MALTKVPYEMRSDEKIEIFNITFTITKSTTSAIGVAHFKAPANLVISSCSLQLFNRGSGYSSPAILEIDVKKNSTPEDTGMTSIFSIKPAMDFEDYVDYDSVSGTLSTVNVNSGDYLRLDITSIPSGFIGSFQVIMYA